jgi:hypothetical protein
VPSSAIPFIALLIMLSPSLLFRRSPWLFVAFTVVQFSIVLFAFYGLTLALYLFAAYSVFVYVLRIIK